MKILLFINYNSGLMHNSIYNNLNEVQESIEQLVEEEELNIMLEEILTVDDFEKHLKINDDYLGKLTNGTWYHLQCYPVFSKT